MVRSYAHHIPSDMKLFLDWIEMSKQEFLDCVWDRRDKRIWHKVQIDLEGDMLIQWINVLVPWNIELVGQFLFECRSVQLGVMTSSRSLF